MIKYNKKDVVDTEKVFKRIMKYVQLPVVWSIALGLTTNRDACPDCGSMKRRTESRAFVMPSGIIKQRFECTNCGRYYRSYK